MKTNKAKVLKLGLMGLLTAQLITGCGSDNDNNGGASGGGGTNASPNLIAGDSWAKACEGALLNHGQSSKVTLDFQDDQFVLMDHIYEDPNCQKEIETHIYTGRYEQRARGNADVQELDIHLDQVSLIARTQAMTNELNNMSFCSRQDYKVNETMDLTRERIDSVTIDNCPLLPLPYERYTIMKVEGNKLSLGGRGFNLHSYRPDLRPTTFDEEVYTK